MYKVIKYFIDLHDKNHEYHMGDVFPREGVEVSAERIAELASDKNRRHEPLIAEEVEQPEAEQPEPEQPAEEEKPAKKPAGKKK